MTETLNFALRVAMLIALYAFLAFAVVTLWRSVARPSSAENQAIPPITLTMDIDENPKEAVFVSAEVLLGREAHNDFTLEHPTVSSRHARLQYRQNQWWFEDLQSTNGSYLDNLRIEEPIVVKDGDTIYCGEVAIHIKIKPLS